MRALGKLVLASGVWLSVTAAAAQPAGSEIPGSRIISLYVVGAPISAVVERIVESYGVQAKIAPNVRQVASSYRIHGEITEVFAKLENDFDLVTFEFNNVFHVSRASDLTTKILRIERATPQAAIEALRSSGLPVDRFRVAPVDGARAVIVIAPDEYVKIAEALLLTMEPNDAQNGHGVIVRRGLTASREVIN